MTVKIRNPNPEEEERKKQVGIQAKECRAQLVVQQPFVGMLIMRMEIVPVVDVRLPTASTDGSKIYLNADFFLSLDHLEKVYLLAHELWHCVFLHFLRKGNRDHRRFNYAADLEVDFMLEKQGFTVKDLLRHDRDWKGLSAEEIYERIENKEVHRSEKADKHEFPGEEASSEPGADELPSEEDIEVVIDQDYLPIVSSGSGRRWRQWVTSVAQQVERTQGHLPGYLKALIKRIYNPELDWRAILQQFVSYCFGGERQWLPPHRRYVAKGFYMPSRKDAYLSVTVAIDTSGSTIHDLPDFLSELEGIVRSFGRYDVTLIECDYAIQNVRYFDEGEPLNIKKMELSGFGGTSFTPVFKYIAENITEPRLLIYLTDGYGDAPETPPSYPVLWVLTSDGEPPVDWGWKAYLEQKHEEEE